MSTEIFQHRPKYDERVKISGWESIQSTKPFDCPYSLPGAAHYKTFGGVDKHYPLETTMAYSFKAGIRLAKPTIQGVKRPCINFTSYPAIDTEKIYSRLNEVNLPKLPKFINLVDPYLSTYQQSYFNLNPKPTLPLMMANSPPMLNRKRKNELIFDPLRTETKFYDDDCITDAQKCTMYLKNTRKR